MRSTLSWERGRGSITTRSLVTTNHTLLPEPGEMGLDLFGRACCPPTWS